MIVTQMKNILAGLGCKLVMVDLNEANLGLDTVTEWPICLLMPPVVLTDIGASGAEESRLAPTFMYFLTRLEQVTIDKPKVEIFEEAFEPMRILGRQFVQRLNSSGYVTEPVTSTSYTPMYSMLDAHIHGCLLQAEINFRDAPVC